MSRPARSQGNDARRQLRIANALRELRSFNPELAHQRAKLIRRNLRVADEQRQLDPYARQLAATVANKGEIIEPWVHRRGRVIEVGAGSGALAVHLALKTGLEVLATDASQQMLRIAREEHPRLPLSNLLAHEPPPKAGTIVLSTVASELYSFAGDRLAAIADALLAAEESLLPGGRVILWDFVRPPDPKRQIVLKQNQAAFDDTHSFTDFARAFGRPIPVFETVERAGTIAYRTDLGSAYEYMFRPYPDPEDWAAELKKRYGFATLDEAVLLFEMAGLSVVHVATYDNPWITANWLKGKFLLEDATVGHPLPYPSYRMLVVGEKPAINGFAAPGTHRLAQARLRLVVEGKVNAAEADAERTANSLIELKRLLSGATDNMPQGVPFDRVLYRVGDWALPRDNRNREHRYSTTGQAALYTATDPTTAWAEVAHREAPRIVPTAPEKPTNPTRVRLQKALDLTDPRIREGLGIEQSQLIEPGYALTQVIGSMAHELDFDGLIAPSARMEGGIVVAILERGMGHLYASTPTNTPEVSR